METDGLNFYYNGSATVKENSEDWEKLDSKGLSRTVSFGNNVSIGDKSMVTPPDLILWGGIILGETA
jgi:hypothetical protein